MRSSVMTDTSNCPQPLATFVRPMLGLNAWGVKQGHGSFLTFEFGQPKSEIGGYRSGSRKSAHVRGQWHLWIYCCDWKVRQDGMQLASSEHDEKAIGRATAALNGRKLMCVSVLPESGRSSFTFDLGGSLETWPYGDDATQEQWMIYNELEVFTFNAMGDYSCGPPTKPSDLQSWKPLR